MNKKSAWFTVDVQGLRQLLARKHPAFILHELLQNAWDEKTTQVDVEILDGGPLVGIRVTDDNPDGFRNLDEAHTLFAQSGKKLDPEKRGRFNLGEKLVLACCEEASITTTTGRVTFNAKGRRRSQVRRASGTVFEGWFKPELVSAGALRESARRLIPPVTTRVHGLPVVAPRELGRAGVTLSTVIANSSGELKNSLRATEIVVHEATDGEGWLFEMGLPVCELGVGFHVDVRQKVPLGFDRDAVRESYLGAVRAAALNIVAGMMDSVQVAEAWVTRALEHAHCTPATAAKVIEAKFGPKRATWDPNDQEANKRATAAGYTVIPGGALPREAWAKVREAGAVTPSGQLFPTPKPYSPDGTPLRVVPPSDWSTAEQKALGALRVLAGRLVGHPVDVQLADDAGWPFNATYGKSGRLTFNRAHVGRHLAVPLNVDILDLLLHELGHEQAADHLSEDYYRALTRYGAELALLLRSEPELTG